MGDTDGDGINNIVIAGNGTKDQVYQWDSASSSFVEPAQGFLKNPPSKIFFKSVGSYQTILTRPSNFASWNTLVVEQKLYGQTGENTLTYTIAPRNAGTCGTPVITSSGTVFTPANTTSTNEFRQIDISLLDPSQDEWCLSANFYTKNLVLTPRLFGWEASYRQER